jgi:hypothetical protein
MDEIASSIQEPTFGVGEIARDLADPRPVRSGKNPRDLDSAGLEVDDEEDEKPNQAGPGEDIGSSDCVSDRRPSRD